MSTALAVEEKTTSRADAISVKDYLAELVDNFPPLTDDQCAQLRMILRPTGVSS
jgi:hypothetical protein